MEKIPEIIHESWHPHIQHLFDDVKMQKLKYDILLKNRFLPSPSIMFNVFRMPIDEIKVVCLGQDPYSNLGEATGYSFSVPYIVKIPPSLEVIRQEIINSKVELDSNTNIDSDKWRELKHWRQQGVFLLNSALTVEYKNPGSHIGYWQWFTRDIVKIISTYNNPVWLMWGSKAKAFTGNIHKFYKYRGEFKNADYNYVLESVHPAAEKYNQESNDKFTGCHHFKITNEILKKQGKSIINW